MTVDGFRVIGGPSDGQIWKFANFLKPIFEGVVVDENGFIDTKDAIHILAFWNNNCKIANQPWRYGFVDLEIAIQEKLFYED